ncbi:MAG: tetratricopeptide repeat protein [Blastocatellia bacterium]
MTLGQSVARTLSGGEQQSYQLVLTAGQYLRLSVEQQHIDVVVTLVGPEGKKLLEVDSPYGYLGPEVVDWIAATAGTYRVEILSPEKNVPTGRYIVQLEALRPATAADQQRMLAAQAQTAGEQAEAEKKAAAFSQALQHYETAARLWQEVGAPLAVATAYFRLGGTARQLQDTPAALAYYEKAAQLHRAANNRTGEAFVDFERGRLYSDRKEPRKAIQALTAALTHFQATLHRQGEAATRLMLGILCKQLNERAQALTHYQELLRLSRELKHRGWEAASLNNLGALYLETGEKQKAGEALTQALQVSRQNRDRMGEASALNGLGSYYHHLGELQKALEHYQLSLQLRREMKDRVSEATTLSNLVALYDSLGEAQKMLDASAQVLQLPNTPQGRAWALSNIGRAYDRLGLPQEALRYYEQSLPLARAQGDQLTEARAINYIGLAHWSLGEQTVALAHFQQALPLFQAAKNPDGEAGVLNNLGLVYKALKQWPQALQAYQQALPLFRASRDRPFEAAALYSLGLVYEQLGERAKALEYQQRSLELSRATGDPRRVAKACYGLARLERAQGKLSQARQHIEQSIAYVELLRAKLDSPELRAAFRASTQEYYDLYIDVLMRQHWRQTGKPRAGNQLAAAALQANERARARSLIEMLSEANTNLRQSVDAALLERERTVQNQLNDKTTEQLRLLSDAAAASQAETLRQAIAQLTAELRDTQAEIRRRSPQYAALTQPEPLTVPALQQQLLAPNTLLLEYALGEERSYLWAVTSTSLHAYALPKRAIIEAAARRFYESLTTRNQAVASETAATRLAQAEDNTAGIALSYLLLRPVAAQLNNQRLLIVADGALQYVPFAALPEPGIGSRWPVAGQKTSSKPVTGIRPPTTDYRPLLVRHEIVTLPSASTLASLRRVSAGRTAATKLAAVLADPVFEVKDERVKQTAPDLHNQRAR